MVIYLPTYLGSKLLVKNGSQESKNVSVLISYYLSIFTLLLRDVDDSDGASNHSMDPGAELNTASEEIRGQNSDSQSAAGLDEVSVVLLTHLILQRPAFKLGWTDRPSR